METIIVTTDFSASAANALNYACAFADAHKFKLVLTHIFTIPVSYTGDGVSLAAVNDALELGRNNLDNELKRAKAGHHTLEIEANFIVGNLLESLQAQVTELRPAMMIMGAAGEYSELWQWDDDWLNALISVPCPVLVIPPGIAYKPIRNIAFACDYRKACLLHHTGIIKKLVSLSGAALHVIHVAAGPFPDEKAGQWQQSFSGMDTHYHFIEDKRIIRAISGFTEQYHIDLLLVMPHKHGLWHSLFNKSYTKQLARLDHLPVMAIHE